MESVGAIFAEHLALFPSEFDTTFVLVSISSSFFICHNFSVVHVILYSLICLSFQV